jgi:hypothetical protein
MVNLLGSFMEWEKVARTDEGQGQWARLGAGSGRGDFPGTREAGVSQPVAGSEIWKTVC